MESIPARDVERLRRLAAQQREIAESDGMKRLYADWARHGRFEKDARPMLTVELWTFADEIVPPLMQCESPRARDIEWQLLSNVIPHRLFGDDTPVRAYYPVTLRREFRPFGMQVIKEISGDSGYVGAGHRFVSQIADLEEDWHLLGKSTWHVDPEATQARIDELNGLFGDLLPARRTGEQLAVHVAEDILHLMTMENLYIAMLDTPELLHEMFERLVADYGEYITCLEGYGLLPAASDEHLSEGSYCFDGRLPAQGENLRASELWGYMDAEEMNDVSPQMYKEFIVDHYRPLAARFGALSYGCCEAVSRFWDGSIETLPNLRKVSISAWCDVRFMGERLRGKDIVFLRKPTANLLGVGSELDENAVSAYFRETAEAARGCRLEVTQRDVYLLHGGPDKVRRYVQLAREAIDTCWKP